jgi:hypothetical protein
MINVPVYYFNNIFFSLCVCVCVCVCMGGRLSLCAVYVSCMYVKLKLRNVDCTGCTCAKKSHIKTNFFKVCKSVHHRTIHINHQPDATVFQFIILSFIYSPICFGRSPAHH